VGGAHSYQQREGVQGRVEPDAGGDEAGDPLIHGCGAEGGQGEQLGEALLGTGGRWSGALIAAVAVLSPAAVRRAATLPLVRLLVSLW
jgi:hypothetical protein